MVLDAIKKLTLPLPFTKGDYCCDSLQGLSQNVDGSFLWYIQHQCLSMWTVFITGGHDAASKNVNPIFIAAFHPSLVRRFFCGKYMKRVTAAIIIRDDKVFIARRAADQKLPGLWEFPGGKIDEGESEQECLERELAEEFGVSATIGNFFMESEYHYGHGSICLLAYFVKELSGEINPTVHDEICWVETTALLKYNLAPADVPIAESLIKRGTNV